MKRIGFWFFISFLFLVGNMISFDQAVWSRKERGIPSSGGYQRGMEGLHHEEVQRLSFHLGRRWQGGT